MKVYGHFCWGNNLQFTHAYNIEHVLVILKSLDEEKIYVNGKNTKFK